MHIPLAKFICFSCLYHYMLTFYPSLIIAEFIINGTAYSYHAFPPAAILAVFIFGILLPVYVFKLFKTRTWFCIPFVISAV
jgi:hypothetical protein